MYFYQKINFQCKIIKKNKVNMETFGKNFWIYADKKGYHRNSWHAI